MIALRSSTRASLKNFITPKGALLIVHNPRWTEEEMILAAEFAHKREWRGVNSKTPGIQSLSEFLRAANLHPNSIKDDRFRSVNSVSMKVNNLIASHPNHTGVGLRSTLAEKSIVRRFMDDPVEMTKLAAKIRTRLQESH